MKLTRRHALAGAAAITAAPLFSSLQAKAAAPLADKQAPSFYRYKIGDIQVTVVSDGRNTFKLEDSFITNAKKEEVNAALEKAFLPKDVFTIHFAPLVINTGGKLVVIDTGNGPVAKTNSKGANGLFGENMVAAGFDPKAVDMVVISHFHGDHVNGLLTADGTPAFPNAEVLVPATEWKFWMDDGEMSRAPAGRMQGLFKNNRNVFEAGLKKKVTPYEWGKEVAPACLPSIPSAILRATLRMCSRRGRARSISSPTSPTIRTPLRPTRAGTRSSIKMLTWRKRRVAGCTTCWWPRSCRYRASITRSPDWAIS